MNPKRILLVFIAAIWFFSFDAAAQTYSPLSPGSDLLCVYLPNGKTQIARQVGEGRHRKLSFKAATKREAKARSQARQRVRKIHQLIKKLQKQKTSGKTDWSLKGKELRAVLKFLQDGNLPTELPPSIDDMITKLTALRDTYGGEEAYRVVLIDLIKRCKKREVPSPGSVQVIYGRILSSAYRPNGDNSGEGHVGAFAVVPWHWVVLNGDSWFCFESPRGGVVYERVSANPCYINLLSDIPGACDHLIERDENGNPKTGVALLKSLNFYFKDRPGGTSFAAAANSAESRLRTNPDYGRWGDSVRYAAVRSVSECKVGIFEPKN